MPELGQAVDAVTTEIVRNRLVAITDEMKTNLMRTAYNMVIYEALDFTVGLFDRDGETISIGLGLPMFVRGLSDTIKAKIAHFNGDLSPDDVLITNDAYIHGNHINHIVVTKPVFYDGQLAAFASAMAHWQDVGGKIAGVTTSIYEEGLQLPILKLYRKGVVDTSLIEIIKMNVRQPDIAMGDLRAQLASIETGHRRYTDLLNRYGLEEVDECVSRIKSQSEAEARLAVESIPNGVYEAESFMDDDGVTVGEPVRLAVRVIVKDDSLTVDLSGISEQVAGYFNTGESAGKSAAEVAFKCLTSPCSYPINDGSFRPVDVILPPGKLLSATRPAAMRCWMNTPMSVVDTIFKALAPAIPERVIAGHHADLMAVNSFGVDHRTGTFFIGSGGMPGGGWGAKHDEDGMNVVVCLNDGDTHNAPIESVEAKLPILFERYELRQDSGGPGRFRGGLGCIQVRRVLSDVSLSSNIDRTRCAPWGLHGGMDGLPNGIDVVRVAEEGQHRSGKLSLVKLEPGDSYVLRSGGGGGFGDPLERSLRRVQEDVVQGYVSRSAAERDYGVLFEGSGLDIDSAGTDTRRRSLRGRRGDA